jgi:hypothetical protein
MHRLDASDGHRDHTTWAGAQGGAGGVHLHPGRTAQRRRPREGNGSRTLAMEETRPAAKARAERCRVHRIPPRGS